MSDQNLRVSRTHSAEEFEGALFGIEVIHFKWIGLALLCSVGLFAGLYYGGGLDFISAGQWAAIPVLVSFFYLRFGHQGKPPGYVADLRDSLITKGHAQPPRGAPINPFHGMPDGFLADGLIVFGGPIGGLVAMGFEIEMPNLQSASYGECNRVQDGIANVLQQLPERMKLQVVQFQTPVRVER
jgi:hypothetical protein